jgi:hypothetical protein
MNLQRSVLILAIFAWCLNGSARPAQAVAVKPAVLSMLVGTWNCSNVGPKGKSTSSITFTTANDLWLTDTEQDGAYGDRPAHKGTGMFGYDSKKQQYVGMGGSTIPGDWGAGTAKASPTATSMTFVGVYPPNPTHDRTAFQFTTTKISSTDTWTEKGKTMTAHATCTKA